MSHGDSYPFGIFSHVETTLCVVSWASWSIVSSYIQVFVRFAREQDEEEQEEEGISDVELPP